MNKLSDVLINKTFDSNLYNICINGCNFFLMTKNQQRLYVNIAAYQMTIIDKRRWINLKIYYHIYIRTCLTNDLHSFIY